MSLSIVICSYTQSPEAFKYQAVVRDGGEIITNQTIGFQLSIIQGNPSGTIVYTETFTPVTNSYGLVNIEIGTGTTNDNFSTINWSNGPYYIETAVDFSGGISYTIMGTSQLISVPYALYSKNAEYVINDNVDDADNDPTNELQILSFSNDTVYLSSGSYVDLSSYSVDLVDDADADPTNELQVLSLSNDTLYLSSGGQIYLGNISSISNMPTIRSGQNSLTDEFVPHDINVTFSSPMPNTNYSVSFSANKKFLNGGGATWVNNKTVNGFTINLENINGTSVLPVVFYWMAISHQ